MELEQVNQEIKQSQDAVLQEKKERSKWLPTASPRKFPLWLRSIIVLVLVCVALVGGLMFGYSVVGRGESATAVFQKELWQHILDFFKV